MGASGIYLVENIYVYDCLSDSCHFTVGGFSFFICCYHQCDNDDYVYIGFIPFPRDQSSYPLALAILADLTL